MTTPLLQQSPQYAALLRRWRELCDKRDDDGLTRAEAREPFRVNGQMDKLEGPKGEQGKEK